MRLNKPISLLCIVMCIIHSACSVPTMDLVHKDQIESTYENRGTIKIGQFEDNRPGEEREEDQIALNTLSRRIWSGSTNPDMMKFFRSVIIEEANKSQIFVVDESSGLELSGYVTSMKVDRRVTVWRFLGGVVFGLGALVTMGAVMGYKELVVPGILVLGGGLAIISLDSPKLTATVEFHAILKQNGSIVFEKDIMLVYEDDYSCWKEWGWDDVSNESRVVLDKGITKSVRILFEEIIAEAKTLSLNKPILTENGRNTR